jgi:tetratricopeptide (TPR) repeat protein
MIGHSLETVSLRNDDYHTETEKRFPDRRPKGAKEEACSKRHAKYYSGVLAGHAKTYEEADGEAAFEVAIKALTDFDRDWGQIAPAQTWAVRHANLSSETETKETREARRLCSDFSAVGALLALRQAPEDRIQWSKVALEAARKLGDKSLQCMHLNHLGLSYTELGRYKEAEEYYQPVIDIAENDVDKSYPEVHRYEGRAYINLALNCARADEYEEGKIYCRKAIKIAQEYEDLRDEGKAQNILGEIYLNLKEIRKARAHCEEALRLAQKIGDFRGAANALGSLGNIYLKPAFLLYSDLDNAVNYYKQALDIYGQLKDERGQMNVHAMLGEAYRYLGDFDQAQIHFNAAHSIAEKLNSPYHKDGLKYYMALLDKDRNRKK